tara:strand:- start:704 stop:3130 length:2427 start_codon:yes stop_codon:yes gene_type:complete
MVQKDKSLNDLTKRLKEFLENQIQELESATTDIANNNAEFVGEITKVRANIISAVSKETDGGKLTGLDIKKDISLSDFMGDTSNLENLNFALGLKHLKIKKNILNAIIKETQGGKLSGLDLDKTVSLSDLLGESPELNAVHALRWLRIKKTILKKAESAVKDVDLELDNKVSLNDILGSTPEQDILTKARFFMIRQGLLKKISKAAKEFDPQQSVDEITGGFGLTSVFSNKPSAEENNFSTLSTEENNLNKLSTEENNFSTLSTSTEENNFSTLSTSTEENNFSTIGSSDAQLIELQGINKNVAKIHDHLNVNTPDVADTIENKKEKIQRDERRHDELIAALAGGAQSKFLRGGGGGDGGLDVMDLLGAKAGLDVVKNRKKGLLGKAGRFLGRGKAKLVGGALALGTSTMAVGKKFLNNRTEKVAKETTEKVSKETTEKVAKETTEKLAKETTEKVAKEATEKVSKEATEKLAKETTEKVAKQATETVGKQVAKATAKATAKGLVKKIPLIGAIAGLGFGLSRALKGDFLGASMEIGSGFASIAPGVGTAASVGIDAALLARDVSKIKDTEGEKMVPPAITAESQLPGSIVKSVVADKNPKNIAAQVTTQDIKQLDKSNEVIATDTMTGKKTSQEKLAEKRREYNKPFKKMIDNLSEDDKEKIRQGVPASRFLSSEQRETIQSGPLARTQSSTGRLGALKKFDLKAKGMIITGKPEVNKGPLTVKTEIGRIATPTDLQAAAPTAGTQIAMQQKANLDLASASSGNTTSVIDASSKVNNSTSSASQITVAAPPHIDKTYGMFGSTSLTW